MRKQDRYLVVIGLLLLFLLCLVPGGHAQQGTPVSQAPGTPWQLGLSWTFNSSSGPTGGFNVKGLSYYRILWVPSGTVSGCTLSFDSSASGGSFSTGGILGSGTIGPCTSANMYVTTTAAGISNFGQLTPTITGSGSLTVVLFGYTDNPAAGGSIGGSVAVTNFPATQPVSAASLPLPTGAATAANQVAPGTAGTPNANVQSVQGISGMTPVKTDGSGVTQPVSLATAPTTPTQPSGFGSAVDFVQSVTASAVALASNATHSFTVCVQPTSVSGSSLGVFIGPSTVTTSGANIGLYLAPGQCAGWQLSNTNLRYVIATGAGQSVNVTGS